MTRKEDTIIANAKKRTIFTTSTWYKQTHWRHVHWAWDRSTWDSSTSTETNIKHGRATGDTLPLLIVVAPHSADSADSAHRSHLAPQQPIPLLFWLLLSHTAGTTTKTVCYFRTTVRLEWRDTTTNLKSTQALLLTFFWHPLLYLLRDLSVRPSDCLSVSLFVNPLLACSTCTKVLNGIFQRWARLVSTCSSKRAGQ